MLFNKTSKQIIIIITLFFFLNIGFLYIYLNRVDKKYSSLLEKELDNFRSLQKITAESNKNFFLLSEILDTKDSSTIETLKQQRSNTIANNTQLFDSIASQAIVDIKNNKDYIDLLLFRKLYLENCEVFYTILKSASNDSSNNYFYHILSPQFLKYQLQLESFTNTHTKDLLDYSKGISKTVKRHSNSVLLFGLSPLILVIISALVYLVLIVFAIFLFKWKPIEFD